jgi:hypothetical protein
MPTPRRCVLKPCSSMSSGLVVSMAGETSPEANCIAYAPIHIYMCVLILYYTNVCVCSCIRNSITATHPPCYISSVYICYTHVLQKIKKKSGAPDAMRIGRPHCLLLLCVCPHSVYMYGYMCPHTVLYKRLGRLMLCVYPPPSLPDAMRISV